MGEAAAKTPYWLREEVRAKQREKYLSLTPEQREERRKRQTELQRLRRARLKKQAAVKGAATGASRIAPAASKPCSASMSPAKRKTAAESKPAQPLRSQDLASYEDLSTHKAKALQRVWRAEVSDYLLEAITNRASPFSGAGLRASKMLCFWFNLSEKLDRIVEADSDKLESQHEMTLAVMLECLRRLTGEGKTGVPVLPGIAGANRKATQ